MTTTQESTPTSPELNSIARIERRLRNELEKAQRNLDRAAEEICEYEEVINHHNHLVYLEVLKQKIGVLEDLQVRIDVFTYIHREAASIDDTVPLDKARVWLLTELLREATWNWGNEPKSRKSAIDKAKTIITAVELADR